MELVLPFWLTAVRVGNTDAFLQVFTPFMYWQSFYYSELVRFYAATKSDGRDHILEQRSETSFCRSIKPF